MKPGEVMRLALVVSLMSLSLTLACRPDDILPAANGCENDADCVRGTCNNGTCGDAPGSSSSSSSSGGGASSGGVSSSATPSSSADSSNTMHGASSSALGSSASAHHSSSGMGNSSSAAAGPQVFVHVTASEAVVTHSDSYAGQTPLQHVYGIRAFSLLRHEADPAPALVFDHGDGFVEASLAGGADTVAGQTTAALLPRDTFTLGRVVISHIGYQVDATMHANGFTMPGQFRNLHIFGNNVTINAVTYQNGDYRFLFHSVAGDFPQDGSHGALPTVPAASGVRLVAEGDRTVLYLPMNITTVPDVAADVHMHITLNTDHCFRWQDQTTAGYAAGVFDSTPTGYEPVMQFGANSYVVTAQ